jgi:hypothetical protein
MDTTTTVREGELHGLPGQPHLPGHYLSWGAIIAGALCAAAIAFVLVTFGSAIGLSAVSPWPHVGLSPTVALVIAALWAAIVQVVAFAAGGYVAGRVRNSWGSVVAHERRFRDGMHGLIVWAVALLVGALLAASAVASLVKTGTEAAATAAARTVSAAAPQHAASPADYAFDYLMRPAPATTPGQPAPNGQELQPAIVRIFNNGLDAGTLPSADRSYLAALVSTRTGMSQADAEKHVDQAFQRAKETENQVRAAADKARKAAVLAAFMAAATLAIGCAAACAGATAGGRHRDEQTEIRLFGTRYFW